MNAGWFEKIDNYVNGKMSSEERSLFESEMTKNEDLVSAVNIYREIEKEMSQTEKYREDESSLKKTLQQLNTRYFKNGTGQEVQEGADILIFKEPKKDLTSDIIKAKKINLGIRLAIAASIIGIIALSVTWYLQKEGNQGFPLAGNTKKANDKDTSSINKNDPANNVAQQKERKLTAKKAEVTSTALYAANFKPDNTPLDKEGPLEIAFINYDNKEYAEAIAAFDNPDFSTRQESDHELTTFYAHYYKALSYMGIKNFQKAIPELNISIAKSPDDLFKLKSQWYLSLAYIKAGDIEKTKGLLNKISHTKKSSLYKTKAQNLLNRLQLLE